MEQQVAATVAESVRDLNLDEAMQKEYIHIIKSSLKGQKLSDQQVHMLFFWARHQNAPEFNFVPAKYRADEPIGVACSAPKKRATAKKGK